MDRMYVNNCFKKANEALQAHGCQTIADVDVDEDLFFVEAILRIDEIGDRRFAECKARFRADPDMPFAAGTVPVTFSIAFGADGKVLIGSRIVAIQAGCMVYREGKARSNSLGWDITWEA